MKLWRYLDLAKLVSLLETETLFFARMDTFDDPFEGATPEGYLNELRERSLDSGISAGMYIAQHAGMSEDFRKYTFVSCWHQSEFESEAMWSLYSDKHKGISIVTDMEKLTKIFPSGVKMGDVKYVDFDAPQIELVPVHFYKRSAFEYEKEVRAVIVDRSENKSGIAIQAKPNDFIEKIVVSPMAQPWFVDVVKGVCRRYNCKFEVESSTLGIKPTYAFEKYNFELE
ncbi:DUF2971 domain-containing protein [Vibrio parahaemolyticus]|uniref:DUF2971 domain-containing protein n=1 Tax=Vibrio parahaemolyticus TaxID=670 RepID=UPI0009EFCDF5|nr:DUF2971 domain-containing protein [Vibrio parahaemolyticus]EGR1558865.1 DUF2971 domain-containing protein [Vibrio parahaemolyticus]EKB1969367.1 DUF2971 domain-containing protein [Vibrio parahaemolyticus]OQU03082.1 hypothetical protein EM85_000645 [Vibrio parahaemolyticus]TOB72086.1 DUF2971 domain-containing protein [Vibrio parahaemolyticus]TOF10868.1 DUF2971 domain-containing protein [Vibrio parahaemolyticus]